MKSVHYPAILHAGTEGSYWVTFPDFENAFSQGKNFDDSINMSIEALTLELSAFEQNGKPFPMPSEPAQVSLNNDETLVFVAFDYDEQKKNINFYRSIKKTLTIPQWLNDAAMKAGINFSAVLQKALKAELGLHNN